MIDQITTINFLSDEMVFTILRWMAVAAMVIYAIFAILLVKQTADLSETLEDPANGVVNLVAWVHFLFAVMVVVVMVVFL